MYRTLCIFQSYTLKIVTYERSHVFQNISCDIPFCFTSHWGDFGNSDLQVDYVLHGIQKIGSELIGKNFPCRRIWLVLVQQEFHHLQQDTQLCRFIFVGITRIGILSTTKYKIIPRKFDNQIRTSMQLHYCHKFLECVLIRYELTLK